MTLIRLNISLLIHFQIYWLGLSGRKLRHIFTQLFTSEYIVIIRFLSLGDFRSFITVVQEQREKIKNNDVSFIFSFSYI